MSEAMDPPGWNENDSSTYRRLAPAAVPARATQLAIVTALLPFSSDDEFTVVELGSGVGLLGHTIALAFPHARLIALDGSDSMRRATAARLDGCRERVTIDSFELDDDGWLGHLDGSDAVVSSLVIHHLDATGKQNLYREIARRTSQRGALVVADLVEPTTPQASEVLAGGWDEAARRGAEALGSTELFDLFVQTQWNIYRFPDPMDRPSPLVDQLAWIRGAGFTVADCYWMEAGHAIYGGYKQVVPNRIDYAAAMRAATSALGTGQVGT